MALDDLISALEEEVTAEIAALLDGAQAAAAAEIQKAQQEAQKLISDRLEQTRSAFAAEDVRLKNVARLRTAHKTHEIKETLFERVFALATTKLAEIRDTPAYASILIALVREVQDTVDAELIWQIDPRDEALLRDILGTEQEVSIEPTLTCMGGVVGVTRDARIWADNTLETRLQRVREQHLTEIMAVLEMRDE